MTTDYEKMDAYLAEIGVSFGAQLIGETVREGNWKADEFRITIRRDPDKEMATSYYMGTGHRRNLRPVAPKAADVLQSLIMDAQAIYQSFENWSSEYGYDSDSRKALRTYDACCEIGRKMRKMFSRAEREKLTELTQDL